MAGRAGRLGDSSSKWSKLGKSKMVAGPGGAGGGGGRRNNMNATMATLNSTALDPTATKGAVEELEARFELNDRLEAVYLSALVDESARRRESEDDRLLLALAGTLEMHKDRKEKIDTRLLEIATLCEQHTLLQRHRKTGDTFVREACRPEIFNLLTNLNEEERKNCDLLQTNNIELGHREGSTFVQLNRTLVQTDNILDEIDKQTERTKVSIMLKHLNDCFEKKNDIQVSVQRGELSKQLDNWLSKADLTHGPARAIIAPHAGYSYCGACAAFAYRQVSPAVVKHIFILGPSHHVRLSGCALSQAQKYETPLYDLKIDTKIYSELEYTGEFEWMDSRTDEDEHSIEMHLPYIAKVMEEYKNQFTIVPILVGSLTPEKEALYGNLLSPYLADPQNLFVISSDFCHWGQRFNYTYYDKRCGQIYKSIENLDKQGMDLIETINPQAFTGYLNKYRNTICGRHPISILLQACVPLARSRQCSLKFLRYAQSTQCCSMDDSSVSYASASLLVD